MLFMFSLTLAALLIQNEATPDHAKSPESVRPTEAAPLGSETQLQDNSRSNQSMTSRMNVTAESAYQKSDGSSDDVGCNGLRSKRYISDGFCRTIKPVSEVLCTGYCIPERFRAWYPEFMKVWGKTKVMEHRCVDGVVRNQKIKLMCDNGKMRSYNIRVVKSCECRKHARRSHHGISRSSQPGQLGPTAAGAAAAGASSSVRRRHRQPKDSKTLSNA